MAAREKGTMWVPIAVAALLTLHAIIALWAVSGKSTTADELIHVTGGYSYWNLDDYRLHPENGILPQRWAAIPAVISQPPFPELKDNPYWRTSDAQVIGHQFFYETGHDHFPTLMAGRAMIVLFNLATGVLVFCWSRRLFGTPGAFVSLTLFAFSPTLLAHGVLATSDACMAFFFLASVGAWWRHLHDGRARWWWLSAAVFGLAWVAKYSAPLIVVMMIAMAVARAWAAEPLALFGRSFTTRGGKFGAAALSALGHGIVAIAVIWAFYGFRYAAFSPAQATGAEFIRSWALIDTHLGMQGQMLRAAAAVRLLPEAFLYGFASVLEHTQMRAAFLNGEYSLRGWPSFFPWTFALKSTLAELAVTALVAGLAARRWLGSRPALRPDLYRVAPLAALFLVYWLVSLGSHLNIGHRHILPTYPVLFIGAGLIGPWLMARRGLLSATVLALLAAQVVEAARIFPHYLAYFNALGGGPENGHRHL
ncbi:MAG: glycosyltransferase family 39 protein, partial [Verrucomicrobia bacterium]|nr:glycosyltransferase family 39 protein [Verrucomicrobiota bacterium]